MRKRDREGIGREAIYRGNSRSISDERRGARASRLIRRPVIVFLRRRYAAINRGL